MLFRSRLYENKDYGRAAEAAAEALKHKPDDTDARDLQRDSTGLAHVSRAEVLGQRGDYAGGIVELNAVLAVLPDNAAAKELLEQGAASIQAVCSQVGYEDIAFFRGLFKRHTGMTPGEYRASFAQMNVRRGDLASGRPAA